jgi:hypothetical protein
MLRYAVNLSRLIIRSICKRFASASCAQIAVPSQSENESCFYATGQTAPWLGERTGAVALDVCLVEPLKAFNDDIEKSLKLGLIADRASGTTEHQEGLPRNSIDVDGEALFRAAVHLPEISDNHRRQLFGCLCLLRKLHDRFEGMFHIVGLAGRYRVRPTICAATLTPRQKLLKKSHSFGRFPGAFHNDLIRLKRSSQVILARNRANFSRRLDADFAAGGWRVVQFTPPGSGASVIFGKGVSPASPGSAQERCELAGLARRIRRQRAGW